MSIRVKTLHLGYDGFKRAGDLTETDRAYREGLYRGVSFAAAEQVYDAWGFYSRGTLGEVYHDDDHYIGNLCGAFFAAAERDYNANGGVKPPMWPSERTHYLEGLCVARLRAWACIGLREV